MVDDANAWTESLYFLHVVARIDNRDASGVDAANFLEDMIARLRINACRRLVQEQEPRLMDETNPEIETVLHAAGKCVHAPVGTFFETDGCKHLLDPLLKPGSVQAIQFAEESQVFPRRQLSVQGQFLVYHADLPAQLPVRWHDSPAQNAHFPAGRRQQARHDGEKRRLAGAVWAEQAEHFAFLDLEADPGKRSSAAVALVQIDDVKDRGCHDLFGLDKEKALAIVPGPVLPATSPRVSVLFSFVSAGA